MSPEQISGYVLLLMMSLLACLSAAFVSGAKYQGRGIYYITINGWFRGNQNYRQWLKENKIYHWCILLIMALVPTILSLAPNFRSGNMILRPEIMTWINPFLWFAHLASYRWFFKKMGKI